MKILRNVADEPAHFEVHINVHKRADGFFVAAGVLHQSRWPQTDVVRPEDLTAKSGECASYNRDRAISYALAELAAKIGGSR